MLLEINGIDFTDYIAAKGFLWQRSDLDSEKSGRTLDGNLFRFRVATKIRLDITCRPLTTAESNKLLTAILPEFVTVRYTDPQLGRIVTRTMYSNNIPASFMNRRSDGVELWDGITFPLIEQ